MSNGSGNDRSKFRTGRGTGAAPGLPEVRSKLTRLGDRKRARGLQRFFKTGPGEYGEGDRFIGARVPDLRSLAKECVGVSVSALRTLLRSRVHEERLLALLVLEQKYSRGGDGEKERLYRFYLDNTRYVNNWDLVDLSAGKILGDFLTDRDRAVLYELAESENIWERRIAIVATYAFIKAGDYAHTLRVADILLGDEEDLIHKAVGWMLREVGKRDLRAEERFLKPRYKRMPRTMLRYAIERFPEPKRQRYLKGAV
jgi:3-methyladenine DNA glycosylase AlkD